MEQENSELCIKVEIGSENTLVGFPYLDEQFFSREEEDETETTMTWLVIDLADQTETTSAQDWFLRTNANVKEWTIR